MAASTAGAMEESFAKGAGYQLQSGAPMDSSKVFPPGDSSWTGSVREESIARGSGYQLESGAPRKLSSICPPCESGRKLSGSMREGSILKRSGYQLESGAPGKSSVICPPCEKATSGSIREGSIYKGSGYQLESSAPRKSISICPPCESGKLASGSVGEGSIFKGSGYQLESGAPRRSSTICPPCASPKARSGSIREGSIFKGSGYQLESGAPRNLSSICPPCDSSKRGSGSIREGSIVRGSGYKLESGAPRRPSGASVGSSSLKPCRPCGMTPRSTIREEPELSEENILTESVAQVQSGRRSSRDTRSGRTSVVEIPPSQLQFADLAAAPKTTDPCETEPCLSICSQFEPSADICKRLLKGSGEDDILQRQLGDLESAPARADECKYPPCSPTCTNYDAAAGICRSSDFEDLESTMSQTQFGQLESAPPRAASFEECIAVPCGDTCSEYEPSAEICKRTRKQQGSLADESAISQQQFADVEATPGGAADVLCEIKPCDSTCANFDASVQICKQGVGSPVESMLGQQQYAEVEAAPGGAIDEECIRKPCDPSCEYYDVSAEICKRFSRADDVESRLSQQQFADIEAAPGGPSDDICQKKPCLPTCKRYDAAAGICKQFGQVAAIESTVSQREYADVEAAPGGVTDEECIIKPCTPICEEYDASAQICKRFSRAGDVETIVSQREYADIEAAPGGPSDDVCQTKPCLPSCKSYDPSAKICRKSVRGDSSSAVLSAASQSLAVESSMSQMNVDELEAAPGAKGELTRCEISPCVSVCSEYDTSAQICKRITRGSIASVESSISQQEITEVAEGVTRGGVCKPTCSGNETSETPTSSTMTDTNSTTETSGECCQHSCHCNSESLE